MTICTLAWLYDYAHAGAVKQSDKMGYRKAAVQCTSDCEGT